MSMMYCHNCDKHIDTDFDAEHFDECGTCSCCGEGTLIELKKDKEDDAVWVRCPKCKAEYKIYG